MPEHIFVLTPDLLQNYPAGWDEEERVTDAVTKLRELKSLGVDTIVDPTVVGARSLHPAPAAHQRAGRSAHRGRHRTSGQSKTIAGAMITARTSPTLVRFFQPNHAGSAAGTNASTMAGRARLVATAHTHTM
jgi:hypothetical protein